MTFEEQSLAIAEHLEWEWDLGTNEMVAVIDGQYHGFPWPSLDAMHEAENTLNHDQQNEFCSLLWEVTAAGQNAIRFTRYDIEWILLHSTSEQRLEAFIRTINKWKE